MKDLSMHIMDIVQNSLSAEASLVTLCIDEKRQGEQTIMITDNGVGMTPDMLDKVTDPYITSRTTRKVGLGLPLFKQNAERTGGSFSITSKQGVGTVVVAQFKSEHFDSLPMGDIAGTIVLLVGANPQCNFTYEYKTPQGTYVFDTTEVKKMLDDTPINEVEVLRFLKAMIIENMNEIQTK